VADRARSGRAEEGVRRHGAIAPTWPCRTLVVPRSALPDIMDRIAEIATAIASASATSFTRATATCTPTSLSIAATRPRAPGARRLPGDHGRLRRGRAQHHRRARRGSTSWSTCRGSSDAETLGRDAGGARVFDPAERAQSRQGRPFHACRECARRRPRDERRRPRPAPRAARHPAASSATPGVTRAPSGERGRPLAGLPGWRNEEAGRSGSRVRHLAPGRRAGGISR